MCFIRISSLFFRVGYASMNASGEIEFYGNSPRSMLDQDWYMESFGINYCMYSVAVVEKSNYEKCPALLGGANKAVKPPNDQNHAEVLLLISDSSKWLKGR